MSTPKDLLGHLSGGRVLDVATGTGGFIHFLLEGLKDYSDISGIDTNERATAMFVDTFKDKPDVRFEKVDALQMAYPDAFFDTVSISNSLHHFDDPQAVLGQMARILRPGGHLILSEMYRDRQTDTQMTHVHLHHWWAAVDSVLDVVHHETYCREEMVALLIALGLQDLVFYDHADTSADPKHPEIVAELDTVIDRYIQRAEGHPDLQRRGEKLRQRVHEIGFHGATSLIVIGTKPGVE